MGCSLVFAERFCDVYFITIRIFFKEINLSQIGMAWPSARSETVRASKSHLPFRNGAHGVQALSSGLYISHSSKTPSCAHPTPPMTWILSSIDAMAKLDLQALNRLPKFLELACLTAYFEEGVAGN